MTVSRVASLVVACLVLAASRAHADPPRLSVTGVFGNGAFTLAASNDVVVRVVTSPMEGFIGEVSISFDDFMGTAPRIIHPVSMGASQSREFVVAVPVLEGAYRLDAELVTRGRVVATAFIDEGESTKRTFVILADPPRIRAAADAIVAQRNTLAAPHEQLSVGVVGIERRSGDPRVPRTHFGWSGTRLVVASAPTIEQLDHRGLEALLMHIEAGGTILVFPRDDEDVHGAALRTLTGPLEQGVPRVVDASPFLPDGVAPCRYEGPGVVRAEPWGATIARGFGSVHVACFDGNAPEHVHTNATRRLLDSLRNDDALGPHPLFVQGQASGQFAGGNSHVELLRRALDANEGARPVLPFVALLLVGYVVLVGPLGFRFAEKRGRPTLALVTTPLLALACLTLLLITGAVAKGFRHRARSVAIVEVVATESKAIERRITSMFFGRPASPDLRAPRDAMVSTTRDGGSGRTVVDVSGERPVVRGFRGGLWSTRLLRTDRALDLGGAVTPTFDGTRLVSLTNGTRGVMHAAVVVDGRGVCYRVGTIAPRGTRPVSARGTTCAPVGTVPYELRSDVFSALSSALGIDGRHAPFLNGLAAYAGHLTDPNSLTVYARLDADRGIETSAFESERELRILRVVMRGPRDPLEPVAPATAEAPADSAPTFSSSADDAGTSSVDGGAP